MQKWLLIALTTPFMLLSMQRAQEIALLANTQHKFDRNSAVLRELQHQITTLEATLPHKNVFTRIPLQMQLKKLRKKLTTRIAEQARLLWAIDCLGGSVPRVQEPLDFTQGLFSNEFFMDFFVRAQKNEFKENNSLNRSP